MKSFNTLYQQQNLQKSRECVREGLQGFVLCLCWFVCCLSKSFDRALTDAVGSGVLTRMQMNGLAALLCVALAASTVSAWMVPHHLAKHHNRLKLHQRNMRALSGVPPVVPPYQYETRWFNQSVDHFNFQNSGMQFLQKYLVNDQWWTKPTPANNFTG